MTIDADHGQVFPEWTFGDKVRKARSIAGLDQREFAEALGVKAGSVAQWETDRAKPRDIVAVARRIEMLTRIPAGWTLGIQESPRPDNPDGGRHVRHEGLEPPTRWLNPHRRSDDPRASGHVIDLPGPDHDGPLDPEPIAAALEAAA